MSTLLASCTPAARVFLGCRLLASALFFAACASGPQTTSSTTTDSAAAPDAAAPVGFTPGPGAREALLALWSQAPLTVDAATLIRASGGPVAAVHSGETLLRAHTTTLDEKGGAVDVSHIVWRILSDDPDQTISWTWAPWREDKPTIRGRVISDDGTESILDPATMMDAVVTMEDLQISDVHRIQVPLPRAKRNAVVELVVETHHKRALVEGAGRTWNGTLWSFAPVRRFRYRVEAPAAASLKVEAVGIAAPRIERSGDRQVAQVDTEPVAFLPFALTRIERLQNAPRFGWSTTPSWQHLSVRYHELIKPMLKSPVKIPGLLAPAHATTIQKINLVQQWMRENLRYTAVHLGEGAIVPTAPDIVLKRGFGDCKDLSVVMVGALQALGVPAHVALTVAEDDPPWVGLPGPEAFNHMVVVVKDKDRDLWVDATAPIYPPGTLPPGVRNQKALPITGTASELVSTTTSQDTRSAFRTVYEMRMASFNRGDATVTSTAAGAAEGGFRASLRKCDEAEARHLIQGDVAVVFGDAVFSPKVKGCKTTEGTVTLTTDVKSTSVLDTGDLSAELRLPSRVVDDLVPESVRGPQRDQTGQTSEAEKDAQRRREEFTGVADAVMRRRGHSFIERGSTERVFRVKLPAHFVVTQMPATRTLKLGPSTLKESARQVDERTVEVVFSFELDKTEWTADDVETFRAAYWKRYGEAIPMLKARFEGARLIDENKGTEAMTRMRAWLKSAPNDGPSRARYARLLLDLGLGEQARVEAEHAYKSAPKDPLTLVVRGNVARHDDFGRLYGESFDRKASVESLRGALTILPHHGWIAMTLADTLQRNEVGEIDRAWTKDAQEAAKLLQDMVDGKRASDQARQTLAGIYLHGHQAKDFARLVTIEMEQENLGSPINLAIRDVLEQGVPAALVHVNRIVDPKEKVTALAAVIGVLVGVERFDDVKAFMAGFEPGAELQPAMPQLKAMARALKPIPPGDRLNDPVSAARAVFAAGVRSTSRTGLSKAWAALASQNGRLELNGTTQVHNFIPAPDLEPVTNWYWLYHGSTCTPEVVGEFARVRCVVAEDPTLDVSSYWRKSGATWKLESLGSMRQLAGQAHNAFTQKRLKEATAWLDWLSLSLQTKKEVSPATRLFLDLWAQGKKSDIAFLRLAVAQAKVLVPSMVETADPSILQDLEKGMPQLSGSMRRRFQYHLADVYGDRREWKKAIEHLTPVAESENEPFAWRWLADLESRAGMADKAQKRITEALANNPKDKDWRHLQARVWMRAGKAKEAVRVYDELRRESADDAGLNNNLLWARLLAGGANDEMEREAQRLAQDENASSAQLHTAGMIFLHRGLLRQAVQAEQRRLGQSSDKEIDDAGLLLRGRLLQVLGFPAEAKEAYNKMKGEDPELDMLAKRFLQSA